jgi:hypothetical protein
MGRSRIMKYLTRLVARSYLGHPDQAEILLIKYPRLRDLPAAFFSELRFRMGSARAHRLTALNVELTNRCNLRCSICPRRDAGARPDCDLDFETFRKIIDGTPGLRVLLPFQWGEPLLSPFLVPAIEYAAGKGIRVFVTTNGTLLDEETAGALVRSGLERLTVSFDGDFRTFETIRGVAPEKVINNIRLFKRVRDDAGSACRLDVSMVVDEVTENAAPDFRKTFGSLADRIQYVPRFLSAPRTGRCRELWRGQMVVLSNGDVTICCADCHGAGAIGNVRDRMPAELFNSRALRALRTRHSRNDLPALCLNCSEYSSSLANPRFS